MGRLDVLYVDDDSDIREIAEMSLMLDDGMEVRACGSGHEALAACGERRPDVILLDVMMPEMDGIETLQRLHGEIDPTLKVIFVTARTHTGEIERLVALGAIGVIRKPFDPMGLADEVRAKLDEAG